MTITNPTEEDVAAMLTITEQIGKLPHYMIIACRYLYMALVNGGMSSEDAMGVLADYVGECGQYLGKVGG